MDDVNDFDVSNSHGDGFTFSGLEGDQKQIYVYNVNLDGRTVYQALVDSTDLELPIHIRAIMEDGTIRTYKTHGHAMVALAARQNSSDPADVTVIETIAPVSVINYLAPRVPWHIANLYCPKK